MGNPFVSTYLGNDFGDYHHIEFKDDKGKKYDFGSGNNNYGEIELFDKELDDNPKYIGKSFKIYWDWEISSFPCCSGEYDLVEAYLPSIKKIELMPMRNN